MSWNWKRAGLGALVGATSGAGWGIVGGGATAAISDNVGWGGLGWGALGGAIMGAGMGVISGHGGLNKRALGLLRSNTKGANAARWVARGVGAALPAGAGAVAAVGLTSNKGYGIGKSPIPRSQLSPPGRLGFHHGRYWD